MSKYDIPVLNAKCPACGELVSHRVFFENKQVSHLRCESCATVHVCAYKGSFHDKINPIGLSTLFDTTTRSELDEYSIRGNFQPADFLEHPSLGVGYVVEVLSEKMRMKVMFADKVRLLLCGPGSGVPIPSDPKKTDRRKKV